MTQIFDRFLLYHMNHLYGNNRFLLNLWFSDCVLSVILWIFYRLLVILNVKLVFTELFSQFRGKSSFLLWPSQHLTLLLFLDFWTFFKQIGFYLSHVFDFRVCGIITFLIKYFVEQIGWYIKYFSLDWHNDTEGFVVMLFEMFLYSYPVIFGIIGSDWMIWFDLLFYQILFKKTIDLHSFFLDFKGHNNFNLSVDNENDVVNFFRIFVSQFAFEDIFELASISKLQKIASWQFRK